MAGRSGELDLRAWSRSTRDGGRGREHLAGDGVTGRDGYRARSPTAATPARATSCSSTRRAAPWTRSGPRAWPRGSRRPTSASTSSASEGPCSDRHPRHGIGLMPTCAGRASSGRRRRPGARPGRRQRGGVRRRRRSERAARRPFYDRARLRAGNVIPGPAVIEQLDSTTVSRRAHRARPRDGKIVIDVEEGAMSHRTGDAARPDHAGRARRGVQGDRHGDGPGAQAHGVQLSREVEDLGGGLFTADGARSARGTPRRCTSARSRPTSRGFMRWLGQRITPGDIIIHNNPLPRRLALARPVRGDPDLPRGRALAWAGVHDPRRDTGGVFPGIAIDVHDVWAEAKIYDSLKHREQGVRNEQLWQHFLRQHAHRRAEPRRHRGDDRRLPARPRALPRADREVRPRARDRAPATSCSTTASA